MTKFKIGDKIRCVDNAYASLTLGREYIVTGLWDKVHPQIMDDTDTPHSGYFAYRFELVTEEAGMKFDDNKIRMSLMMRTLAKPLYAIAAVLTYGAKKYLPNNWQGVEAERYEDALDRHLTAWRTGETIDPDTGLHHLAHAGCNVLFLLYKEIKDKTLAEISTFNDPTEQYKEQRDNANSN